ncbi:MAG TPA: glycosyltransferase family 39 protein [Actinomycetes bacterium]|nr:glycosyltransferase family 39 protein [Actinomycetes bacterium]
MKLSETPAPARPPEVTSRPPRRATRPGALLVWAAVLVLVGQMAAAMLLSARGDAPTFDEQVHLTGGIAYLRYSELRVNYEHPPLVKLLAGLGALAGGGVRTPDPVLFETARQGVVARALFYGSGNDPDALLWRGRLPMMTVAVVLALVVFGFARDLFGAGAALVPLAFVTLDPNVLGHGRLVTTDVGMTLLVVACLWALWRAWRRSWRWLPLAGVAFGLALTAKFSAILVAPAVGLLVLGVGYARARAGAAGRGRALLAAAGGAALVAVLSVAVVWLVYLGIDPWLRFDPALFPARGALAGVADALPLPHPYRAGLRYVLFFDQHDRPAYLFGERYLGGRPLFYPAVLAIKTPLGALAAWALALAALAAAPRARRLGVAAFVLFPAAWMLAVAMTSQTNIGVRHVLLVPVLLAVATGALWALRPRGRPVGAAVACVLVLAAAASVWRVHPSYLAYVNEAFGGPDRGYRLVADSNLDWGQDLARAAGWVRAHPGGPVWLLYFGSADPRAYGLYAVDLWRTRVDRSRVHGLVLVSASVLALYPEQRWVAQGREPVAQIGHSILVYRLP